MSLPVRLFTAALMLGALAGQASAATLQGDWGVSTTGYVSASTFYGDGANLTNISGDNLGNHTATQNLGMGANDIVFGNNVSDKIYYYSNSYGVGIESSTLTHWSGSAFRWRIGGTTASGGTESMLLNTSGLSVQGDVTTSADVSASGAMYASNWYRSYGNTGWYSQTHGGGWYMTDSTWLRSYSSKALWVPNTVSATNFRATDGDSAATPGHAWSTDTNTGMFHPVADTIGWSVNGTEKLRLTSTAISTTGNISLHDGGIIYGDNGDTNYTSTLSLIAGADANTGPQITMYGIDANGGGRIYMYATSDTTGFLAYRFHTRTTAGANSTLLSLYQGGDATLTGDMTAAAFLYSSDQSLKRNIATSQGLELVRQLHGVTFDWKATGKPASGVIAQEVEKVMPHVVKMGKEGTKVVDYPQLIAPLIEAVKDLDRENQALKAELAQQRTAIEQRLKALENPQR